MTNTEITMQLFAAVRHYIRWGDREVLFSRADALFAAFAENRAKRKKRTGKPKRRNRGAK